LLPRPLRDYVSGDFDTLPWQWKGVGVHYAPLMKDMSGSRLGLLRVAAGTAVPHHGHSADELTMVLAGGYSNEFGSFLRGDVEYADADIVHQPVADADGPCLCLVITRGRLRPTGLVARALVPFLSF
jgi:putative transcriptional regulator